jgi:CcmD family protein
MKKLILFFALTFNGLMCSFAQANQQVEMATGLRSSGKIYVVVLALTMVFIGVSLYLFSLDRRISKIEKTSK